VTFDLDPPLLHTSAEVHDADRLRTWFATFDGPIQFDVQDLTVAVGGDVAFCYGLSRLSAVPQGSTESFELWHRTTIGLRKIDGAWKIAHLHSSTPFYMDGSFSAATDLKP
jgi:ketosteroid isomerase-like protein